MLPPVKIPTPFQDMRVTGDHVEVSPLEITFMVDENCDNYFAILEWLTLIGFPDSWDQYSTIYATAGQYTSGSLSIMNNLKVPTREIFFEKLFPIDLTNMEFASPSSDVKYVTATAKFMYQTFTVNTVNTPTQLIM